MAMELAPDNSEALHSEVDVPNYVFPEEDSQGEPDPPDDAPVMNRLGFVAGTDEFLAKLNQDIQPVPKTQESVALRRRHVFETIGRIYDVASLLDRERYSPSRYNFVMVPGEDRYKDSDYSYKLGMTEPPCARKEESTIGRHQDKKFHHRDSGQESYSEQGDSSGDEVEDEKGITPDSENIEPIQARPSPTAPTVTAVVEQVQPRSSDKGKAARTLRTPRATEQEDSTTSSPDPPDPPRGRLSTRKAARPSRLKPSTPSVAKTPARVKAAATDMRRRKKPVARSYNDATSSDQEEPAVAEIVDTTGGGMAGDD
jgi:hypothetical protein